MSPKTSEDATNYSQGMTGDKAKLDSVSTEAVLQDYVMLDFVEDFVPSDDEAHAKRAISGGRWVPRA